jgi:hypothetical protein
MATFDEDLQAQQLPAWARRPQPGVTSTLPLSIAQYQQRANDLRERALAMEGEEPDLSQMQEFARARQREGSAALMGALAAQFAGEQFQPVQAQFLKQAAAAQEPIKLTGGLLTPEGKFLKDPFASREKMVTKLMDLSKAYDQIAATAQTAQEKNEAMRNQHEIANMFRMMGLDLQQQMLGIRASGAADSADLRRMMFDERLRRQEQQDAEKKEKDITTGATALSKRLEELTNLYSGVRGLNERLTGYAEKGVTTLPGMGYLSDVKLRGIDVAGPFLGEEGKINRSLVKNVTNELLRAASGQAVTLSEDQRAQLVQMATGNYSQQDFLNAWSNVIVPKMNEAITNLSGGYSPEVKQRYLQQGGRIDVTKPFVAPTFGQRGASAGGTPAAPALSADQQRRLEELRQKYRPTEGPR